MAPAKLSKQAFLDSCGLFFPYGDRFPIGLAVGWNGETRLIHLAGSYAFQETGIDVGHSIRGVLIKEFAFRVDAGSRYDSAKQWDPPGALVTKGGELFLYCTKLGYQFHDDPHPVPLGNGGLSSGSDEACGFKRWSIAILDHGRPKLLQSFEALPAR